MTKYDEKANDLRNFIQALLNENNVEQIAEVSKAIDSLEEEHKKTEEELKGAKNTLVKYVKEYAFKNKSEDKTGIEKAPSLDEAFAEAFKEK